MTKTFALFGAGRIGRIHAANIAAHAGARLKYVVDVDATAAARHRGRARAPTSPTRRPRSQTPPSMRS